MSIKSGIEIVREWFEKWEEGDFLNLPIKDSFTHTSPFGKITGKDAYLELVESNRDKFLGYTFVVHDIISDETSTPIRVCVRYSAVQGDFELEVSEWHFIADQKIQEVVAYYHVGEIRADRKLNQ